MPSQIIFGASIAPVNTPMEVTINGGTTFTPATFATVGSIQQYTLTGVPATTYAINSVGLRAVGYPNTVSYNQTSFVVTAASVNRALQFNGTSQYATLPDTGTAVTLGGGVAWDIETRIRLDSMPAVYAWPLTRTSSNQVDYSLIYNLAANTWSFYANNQYGTSVNLPLTSTTAVGAFNILKFSYDGVGTLNAFLNGVAAGTRAGAITLASGAAGAGQGFGVGFLTGQGTGTDYRAAVTYDWLKVTRAGVVLVDLEFNETTGTYANTGTAGGVLTLTGAPTSLAL